MIRRNKKITWLLLILFVIAVQLWVCNKYDNEGEAEQIEEQKQDIESFGYGYR